MPNLSRRRDIDTRGDRLESEVRSEEFHNPSFVNARKFQCMKCKHMYEEKSRNCPRCDTHTMGELKPIEEKYLNEARRGAVRRAKEGRGINV